MCFWFIVLAGPFFETFYSEPDKDKDDMEDMSEIVKGRNTSSPSLSSSYAHYVAWFLTISTSTTVIIIVTNTEELYCPYFGKT